MVDQGIEKRYVKRFDIYGVNNVKLCRAQLRIDIDWNRHSIHLREGRDAITVPDKWFKTGAIEIDEMTKAFREFVTAERLETIWHFIWADGVNDKQASRELGVTDAEPVKWRSGQNRTRGQQMSTKVSLADEMTVGLYVE